MEYITFENVSTYLMISYILMIVSCEFAQYCSKVICGERLKKLDCYPLWQTLFIPTSIISIFLNVIFLIYVKSKPNSVFSKAQKIICLEANKRNMSVIEYRFPKTNRLERELEIIKLLDIELKKETN